MGSRDYRHREPKKTKKGAKKPVEAPLFTVLSPVEVVPKRRKGREERTEA